MMKKIYSLLTALVMMMSFTSCDSIFRDEPFDKLAETEIWGDEMLLNE